MKIIMATTWHSECGIAVYSRSLTAELRKETSVEIVSLDPGMTGPVEEVAARLNWGDTAHIQFQYPFFGGMAFHRNWFRRLLAKVRVPVVVTIHELDLGEADNFLVRMYKPWFNHHLFGAREISRIIVHTSEHRDKLVALGIEHVCVIPDGVPSVPPPPVSADAARKELGLPGRKVVTVFGFVVRRKGYEIALEALSHLPDDVSLLIAGGPHPGDRTGYFEEIQRAVEARDLSTRVLITGYLPEDRIPLVMAATDVIAAPFIAMANSASILRSIAYRKPIVASDLPAAREINDRHPCLSLVRPGDPCALADAINRLLEDPVYAVEAVETYAEKFSIARTAEETLEVYKDLLP